MAEAASTATHEPGQKVVVEFELDWRTHALVMILGEPGGESEKTSSDKTASISNRLLRMPKLYFPFVVFLGVASIQILMTLATWAYVTNGLVLTRLNPLLTSYEIFVGSNTSLPKGLWEPVCGSYQDLGMANSTTGPLSKISMPDGGTYTPSTYDMIYHLKMPFRSFNYAKMGPGDRSVLDDTLYVIHEGLSFNPFGKGAGYSLLFMLMMGMWLFAIFVEYRAIVHNCTLLVHFHDDSDATENFQRSENGDKYKLVRLNWNGRFVLGSGIIMRTVVTTLLLLTGCQLLINTTAKIDLILNALALLFVLEINSIFFFASVSGVHQQHIQDLEPVVVILDAGSWSHLASVVTTWCMPAFPFLLNFFAAACLRVYQLRIYRIYMRMCAAMCLFAGAVPGEESGYVAPVTGFCETLLSVRCAPDVTPNATLQAHGRCVITDQGVGQNGTMFLYMEDERIFEGRDKNRSWASWGAGMPELYERGLWSVGPFQDIMRKNCLQLYQKTGFVEDHMVDAPTNEKMPGAPFYCSKEAVWGAMFGKFTEGVGAATGLTTDSIQELVADLRDPQVVKAIDACQSVTPVMQPHGEVLSNNERLEAANRTQLLSTHEHVHTRQQTGGARQKKLGAAGVLSIPRPSKQADALAEH